MIQAKNRFKGNRQIMTIIKKGQSVYAQNSKLKYLINANQENLKFTVVVSRKVSKKAVVRNRIRRRVYETIRRYHLKNRGMFALFVYSENFAYIKHEELKDILNELFTKTKY
ncbi:MAG: ribonuclease P protein component [Candidatus Saccharimonadales bacterium]